MCDTAKGRDGRKHFAPPLPTAASRSRTKAGLRTLERGREPCTARADRDDAFPGPQGTQWLQRLVRRCLSSRNSITVAGAAPGSRMARSPASRFNPCTLPRAGHLRRGKATQQARPSSTVICARVVMPICKVAVEIRVSRCMNCLRCKHTIRRSVRTANSRREGRRRPAAKELA
jgi:hypothetical protein